MRRLSALALLLLLPLACPSTSAGEPSPAGTGSPAPGADDRDAQERMIIRAFSAARYEKALELVDEYLGRWPETPHMHYNRACAFALLGRRDAAGQALLDAVEQGFRDFETMKRDPDLASMRDHETFTAILEARGRIVRDSTNRRAEQWRERYDEGYVHERDAEHRLHVATGLGGRAHAEMMTMIEIGRAHV